MNNFVNLLSPLEIRGKIYRNRIAAAPVNGISIKADGIAIPEEVEKFARKSAGGAASVCIGETPVDFEYAQRFELFEPFDYGNRDSAQLRCFRAFADAIHNHGALAMIELFHCGISRQSAMGYTEAFGPCGGTADDGVRIIGMDEAAIKTVADHFAQAALFMKWAGFDGVVLHGGHGWLLHQFLSSIVNKRTDEYGGCAENRAKFPVMVAKAVRERCGEDFIIELRVSGCDWRDGGVTVEDTAVFAHMAEPYIDLLHVSAGDYRDPVITKQMSSMYHDHACNVREARHIRDSIRVPIVLVGGINSPEQAEELLQSGVCDFVALGRQFTADPCFPKKVIDGKTDDIARCIRCFRCFPGPFEDAARLGLLKPGCTINPYFDRSVDTPGKADHSRKVLVAGGGVAGMQAAITASDRGHEVVLAEQGDALGGILLFTDTDTYKEDLRNFKNLLVKRVIERPIKLLLNQPADENLIRREQPDVIIAAVGSLPLCPPIPGIEHAIPVLDVYRGAELGKSVVIIGGGLAGCETGLHLAALGHHVTVVEMQDSLAPDSYPTHRVALLKRLETDIVCKTGIRCARIGLDGVVGTDKDGNEVFIPGDSFICAMGMRANQEAVDALKACAGETTVIPVGDCVRARTVYYSMFEATTVALDV